MITHRGIICSILVIYVTECTGNTDYETLLSTALFNGYDSKVLAKCGSSQATTVRLDLAIRQVVEMDEPKQILKLNLWVRLKWLDCRLSWDPNQYNNITNIVVPYKYIWTPDITLYDSVATEFVGLEDFRPSIYSDGTVYYNFPTILESLCPLDVVKFPYDSQTCKLMFGSWSHHGFDLDLVYKNPFGDITAAESNVEWNVTSFVAERHVVYYTCCVEPYPDVTFYLKLQRKPTFYLMNLIIPSFLITAIAILGFFLPVESGEKVSLQMTVMLSLAVFQLLVADSLPPSSTTPLIGTYFNLSLFLVGYACLMAVIVLAVHYQGSRRPISRILRLIFIRFLAKITCVPHSNEHKEPEKSQKLTRIVPEAFVNHDKQNEQKKIKINELYNDKNTMRDKEVCDAEDQDASNQDNMTPLSPEEEWAVIANVIDRVSSILFLSALVIGAGIIFSNYKT